MPELPEVETIRRQLAPHVEGRTIVEARILDPRWTRPDPPAAVEAELRGAVIERVSRAGKYLVWSLSGDRFLIQHLRMTGTLLYDPAVAPPHTHVILEFDDGHRLVYVDPRRFGTGHLVLGAAARDEYLNTRIGIEPMTPEFTAAHLRSLARGRVAPAKAFVLDQRHIAGVGNIYADEALFRARIHPLRPAGRLTLADWERVREGIEEALRAGIEAKGARVIPGPVPGSPPRRRAVPAVRLRDPQDRGGGKGDVRVRALPAQAARRSWRDSRRWRGR